VIVTYPLMTVVDDSGAIVSGATVAIASVKDKSGADIAMPGATVRQSGANVAVDYDAAAKGEAWIVLAISKAGSTFTGLNASPAFYLSADPSSLASVWRRFFKKATRSPTQIITYADDGSTVLTSQTISDDGAGNEVQGAAT
jgi:hypothetical protein